MINVCSHPGNKVPSPFRHMVRKLEVNLRKKTHFHCHLKGTCPCIYHSYFYPVYIVKTYFKNISCWQLLYEAETWTMRKELIKKKDLFTGSYSVSLWESRIHNIMAEILIMHMIYMYGSVQRKLCPIARG